MNPIIDFLYGPGRSEWSDEVKTAIYLYSQSALQTNPAEKLLTILIPLESLLLKNRSEPITDNIAHRLAFTIGEDLDERRHIVQVTRAAYELRSAFVHHLRPIERDEDLETVRRFMEFAWLFFLTLGASANIYPDKAAFLNLLDDRKLS
jgi:hypothetical protein